MKFHKETLSHHRIFIHKNLFDFRPMSILCKAYFSFTHAHIRGFIRINGWKKSVSCRISEEKRNCKRIWMACVYSFLHMWWYGGIVQWLCVMGKIFRMRATTNDEKFSFVNDTVIIVRNPGNIHLLMFAERTKQPNGFVLLLKMLQ